MLALRSLSRYRAASYHLAISAGVGALVLLLMLALWYPPPLFTAMGGQELMLLIVGVDVVMGPLITLIIFNPKKKELPFDLSIVATLQLAALGYGMYAMHTARPVFTVFAADRFFIVAATEIDPADLARGRSEEFRRLSQTGPRLVATQAPESQEERNDIAFGALGGMGIQNLPKYFVPYAQKQEEVLRSSRPVADLQLEQDDSAILARYLKKSGLKAEALRCLPVKARRSLMTALIAPDSGELLEILPIRPDLRSD